MWEAGLWIRSFAHCLFVHLLRLLRSNERLCVICSDHSGQMSDCERIAPVAHDKWATVSELLVFFSKALISSFAKKNEQFAQFFLTKIVFVRTFFCTFFESLRKTERFAHSLFLMSEVSELLRSLTKNEQIAFAHYLLFSQKTSDSLRKPISNSQPWLEVSRHYGVVVKSYACGQCDSASIPRRLRSQKLEWQLKVL